MISNKRTLIWILITVLVVIIIIVLISSRPVSAPSVPSASIGSSTVDVVSSSAPEYVDEELSLIHATFICPGGEMINAVFHNGENSFVDLALPDRRILRVPQALSADGARYATENEMFVFWNKGDKAFIEERIPASTDCFICALIYFNSLVSTSLSLFNSLFCNSFLAFVIASFFNCSSISFCVNFVPITN